MTFATDPCLVRAGARAFGDAPALLGPDVRLSFRELDQLVDARARSLAAQGDSGNWVIHRATPNASSLIEFLALLRAESSVLPVNPALPAAALSRLIGQQGIVRFADSRTDPALGLHSESPGAGGNGPQGLEWPAPAPLTGMLTSGSTGEPKVAVHSERNHVLSAEGFAAAIPIGPGDRYLLALPWFHVGGLAILFRCVLHGAAIVLGGRAEDAHFLRTMGVTHASMVETQLRRLLAAPDPLPPLRCVLLGGGPVRASVRGAALARGLPVWQSYGLTETASLVIAEDPDGRVHLLPHRECRIADDGEILVRGGTLFLGYLDRGTPVPANDAGGWFHTRDLGEWDTAGFRVTGRLDNRFISGGENVQPEAIEAVLREHPVIAEAVVVPRPDDEFGQRPVAFLDCIGAVREDALRDWLRPRLNPWLLPVAFHPLPRNDGMKFRRADLLRLAAQPVP
ncbi:O-succinylbenzoic acid--CoA ligase [Thioalkalivibrio nitratireducens DSM 14787]|uniref:O-succinylbenzoic acid--CoA ligase n=1 Tax=Thioalkalivibrio nitratireducens (strain DSM 14787 / UNIQEM 213 / ALEN2) TaxID=1255043 RepID=L0DUQ6_THIND|nr:AMP-binding protein [Thioalkalivibrio nitratireducens]AGA33329.1 O-succinylbenzoic acid--CoA ligase [Thioalkalivibrio nitratireducens DSM 14787]